MSCESVSHSDLFLFSRTGLLPATPSSPSAGHCSTGTVTSGQTVNVSEAESCDSTVLLETFNNGSVACAFVTPTSSVMI